MLHVLHRASGFGQSGSGNGKKSGRGKEGGAKEGRRHEPIMPPGRGLELA